MNNFKIQHGIIKFFENPHLCFWEIQSFMFKTTKNLNKNSNLILSDEVSFDFNGYRRFTCSNNTIDLKFKSTKHKLSISWNATFSDLRILKGFILFHTQVPFNISFDQYDMELLHSSAISISYYKSLKSADNFYEWDYEYIQFDELLFKKNNLYKAIIDVKPFSRYAIYLKADLSLNYNGSSLYFNSLISDKIISKIHYVFSLPASKF
jgi:hypothetical protein